VAAVRRVPVRTCVACRTTGGKKGLLRVVRNTETGLAEFDPTGKRPGRGAYVCVSVECVANALRRKALERALKAAGCHPQLQSTLVGVCAAPIEPARPDAVS